MNYLLNQLNKIDKLNNNRKFLHFMNDNRFLEYKIEDKENFLKMLKGCDINLKEKSGWTPLMYTIYYNSKFQIETNIIYELLQKCDINQQNKNLHTPLMMAINSKNISFSKEQICELFEKCDRSIQDSNGWNTLLYLFAYNKEKWNISPSKIQQYFMESTSKVQKDTFQWNCKRLEQNFEHDFYFYKVINEIIFLKDDCQFHLDSDVYSWLEENKCEKSLKILKSKDYYFELEKNLSTKRNNPSKNTLKI